MREYKLQGTVRLNVRNFFEWFAQGDLMDYLREYTDGNIPSDVDQVFISVGNGEVTVEYTTE